MTTMLRLVVLLATALSPFAQTRPAPPRSAESTGDPWLGLSPKAPLALEPVRPTATALPNGLRIRLAPGGNRAGVWGAFVVRAGRIFDPADQRGIAELTMAALGKAHGSWGDDALDAHLSSLGATMQSSISSRHSVFTFACPPESLSAVLASMSEAIRSPRFSADAVENLQGRMRSAVAGRRRSAELVARFALRDAHRIPGYYQPVEEAHIANTAFEDVVAFHASHYVPNATLAGVAGSFDPAAASGALARVLASWNGTAPPLPTISAQPDLAGGFADGQEFRRAVFEIGWALPPARSAGRPAEPIESLAAYRVLQSLLNLPTGLARIASAHSTWEAQFEAQLETELEGSALFIIRGAVDSSYAPDALALAKQELSEFAAAPLQDVVLETAKAQAAVQIAAGLEDPAIGLVSYLTREEAGLDPGAPARLVAAIQAVSSAQLKAAMQSLASRKDSVAVLAASSRRFLREPAAYKLGLPPIDLAPPKLEIARRPPGPESAARGRQLFDRMIEALGGAARIGAIKDLTLVSEAKLASSKEPFPMRDRFLYPSTWRQDQTAGISTNSVFYDGTIGWISRGRLLARMAPHTLFESRGELFRSLPNLLASASDGETEITSPAGGLVVITRGGYTVRFYLEETTGLPERLSYQGKDAAATVPVEELWSDWMVVDGVRFPGQIVIRRGGRPMGSLRYKEIRINTGITAASIGEKP